MLFCHNQTVPQFNLQNTLATSKNNIENLFADKHYNAPAINKEIKEYEYRL